MKLKSVLLLVITMFVFALASFAQVSQPFTLTGLAGIGSNGTNAAAFTTNTPTASQQVIPVKYAKPGSAYTSPLPSALWLTTQGSVGPQTTNTYYFANSRDGTLNTLVSSNYWWSVSVISQGTNPVSAFVPLGASNYVSSQGFVLVQTVFGGTNAMTNLSASVTWPE